MDIKVCGVDVAYVKEIDRKAEQISKKIGRRFSRNEYIKMLIQNDAELRLLQLKEQKFDETVENLLVALKRQEAKFQEYIDSNSKLFLLMASGDVIQEGIDELE